MKPLDAATLEVFLKRAVDRLHGEWTLIGGCVLPALGVSHRATMDIDLCGPADATLQETLALLELATELGMPPEAVNQAGSFFLRRIPGYERDRVVLMKGATATLYRPNVTLFLLLKIARFTESDLSDCLSFLDYARSHGEPLDVPRVRAAICDALLQKNPSRRRRLRRLLQAIESECPQ